MESRAALKAFSDLLTDAKLHQGRPSDGVSLENVHAELVNYLRVVSSVMAWYRDGTLEEGDEPVPPEWANAVDFLWPEELYPGRTEYWASERAKYAKDLERRRARSAVTAPV
jgi:hypothetical protein